MVTEGMIVEGRTMRVAKVSVSNTHECVKDGNVIQPLRRVRVILENGVIFERTFNAFRVEKSVVLQNFQSEEEQWTRMAA